ISFGDECLASCADDGSVVFWSISNRFKDSFCELVQLNEEILIDKDEFTKKSKIIESYEDKLKESKIETNFKLRMKELKFNIKKRELKSRFNNQMIDLMDKIETLKIEDKIKMEQFNLDFDEMIAHHMNEYQRLQDLYENKILFEEKKNVQLDFRIENLKQQIELNR
ncbi:cilia- and flagella-associated 57, partial [Brachionus plicatilis]